MLLKSNSNQGGGPPSPVAPPGERRRAPSLVYNNSTSETFSSGFATWLTDLPDDLRASIEQNLKGGKRWKGCKGAKESQLIGYLYENSMGDPLYVVRRFNKRCKRRDCPFCNEVAYRMLLRRLREGELYKQAERLSAAKVKYGWKFLTLTLPGAEYRAAHNGSEGVAELRHNFHKLMVAMKKRWGDLHYFSVIEAHKDGFPHLHALLVNKELAPIPKEILAWLWRIWRDKYGMGRVDLSAKIWDRSTRKYIVPRDAWSAVFYSTKYMSKTFENYEGKKVFTSSEGALAEPGAGIDDYGTALFLQGGLPALGQDECPDTGFNVLTTKSTEEIEEFKIRLQENDEGGRVVMCNASPDELSELKKRFPNALLPKRKIHR